MDELIDRKEFLRKGLKSLVKPLARLVEEKLEDFKTNLLRPPGAIDEISFVAVCTKCDLCREACPHGAIKMAGAGYGIGAGTPYIDPKDAPCKLCEDMPCIKVCEPGALREVKREDVRIGVVEIKKESCLAWRGMMCDVCLTECPFPGTAIRMDGLSRPSIDKNRCTGCGICVNVCVARPSAVEIKPVER